MLFCYPAAFYREGDDYWAEFPDLEGCHTFGSGLNETMENAQEALAGHLLTLLEAGEALPAPRELSAVPLLSDGFTTYVTCKIEPYKDTRAVKKTLTVPAWLNERATERGINFSQTLQDALLAKLRE